MKSDSDHNSQRSTVNLGADLPAGQVIETQETNCPEPSVADSEKPNSTSADRESINDPCSGVPDNHVSLIWDSEESSDPVAVPITEWPPENIARTLDGRFAQWNSFVMASPRDMTEYDLRVITFGRKVADHLTVMRTESLG